MSIRKLGTSVALTFAAFAAALSVACGDDAGGSSSGGSVKTGSDDQYVGDMCKAFNTWLTVIDKVDMNSASSGDVTKILDVLVKPTEQLARDFSKMKPPADMKDWHAATVKALTNMSDTLKKSKDLSALDSNPFPQMPADAEARLSTLAEAKKDCQNAGPMFGVQ